MQANKALSSYRIEQAQECLDTAKLCLEAEKYKTAANRSYYCVFHAIRAILALDGMDFKKHRSVINYFRVNYIKEGTFDKKLSIILRDLFEIRNSCDYNDYYVVSKKDVECQVAQAEHFLNEINKHINSR